MDSQLENQENNSQDGPNKTWIARRFEKRQIDEGQPWKRICSAKGCSKEYSLSVSHNTLKNHWRDHHDAREFSSTVFTFHDDHHNDRIIKHIIKSGLEYSNIERDTFKLFVKSLNPNKKIINKTTISKIIVDKSLQMEGLVKSKLKEAPTISLTFDIWSARKGSAGYGCVTAHFITQSFKIEAVVLEFCQLSYPHDTETLSEFLSQVITRFEIKDKLISITTDNARNNISAIRNLSLDITNPTGFKFLHVRCFAHVINLAVEQAIKRLDHLIGPIKKTVLIINSSGKRKARFDQLQMELNMTPLALIDDVQTRWNSTYLMIQRAIKLQDPLIAILTLKSMPELDFIGNIDWEQLRAIAKFLKPFFDVTEKISGQKYCTVPFICSIIPKLISLSSQLEFDNPVIQEAGLAIQLKLSEYSDQLEESLLMVATTLDPRVKLSFLPAERHEYLRDLLRMHCNLDQNMSRSSNRSSNQDLEDESEVFEGFVRDRDADEIELYLNSQREPLGLDIMSYWGTNSNKYPVLANLARQILAIQSTSVASERVFSGAHEIDTPRRNRLSEHSFRANVLLASWMQLLDIN